MWSCTSWYVEHFHLMVRTYSIYEQEYLLGGFEYLSTCLKVCLQGHICTCTLTCFAYNQFIFSGFVCNTTCSVHSCVWYEPLTRVQGFPLKRIWPLCMSVHHCVCVWSIESVYILIIMVRLDCMLTVDACACRLVYICVLYSALSTCICTYMHVHAMCT